MPLLLDNLDCAIDNSHADFTLSFVLNKLNAIGKLGGGTAGSGLDNVANVSFVKMSTGGFLSDLYRIQIQFKLGTNDNTTMSTTFTCIFKVPTSRRLETDAGCNENKAWMYKVHNAECHFYTSAAPLVCAMPVPPPFHIPELYACRHATSPDCLAGAYLLLEDVSGSDVIEVDPIEGLTKEQAESAIRGIAHFHALCLCLPRELVDSFTLKTDLNLDEEKLRVVKRLMATPQCAQQFAEQEEALVRLYNDYGHYEPDQHTIFSVAPVIVHGDYWSNNMFFKVRHEQNVAAGVQLSAMFDWQICHSGTGVNDMLRVIYVSVDAALRRAHFDEWISLYCSEMHTILAQLTKDYPQATDQLHQRPLGLIRQMVAHHSAYELCFQLFLLTNIVGTVEEEQKRLKLIKRMQQLYEDVKKEIKLI